MLDRSLECRCQTKNVCHINHSECSCCWKNRWCLGVLPCVEAPSLQSNTLNRSWSHRLNRRNLTNSFQTNSNQTRFLNKRHGHFRYYWPNASRLYDQLNWMHSLPMNSQCSFTFWWNFSKPIRTIVLGRFFNWIIGSFEHFLEIATVFAPLVVVIGCLLIQIFKQSICLTNANNFLPRDCLNFVAHELFSSWLLWWHRPIGALASDHKCYVLVVSHFFHRSSAVPGTNANFSVRVHGILRAKL